MPLTRRQKAGLEPLEKESVRPKRTYKKKTQKQPHNNMIAMILLMPLYAYMVLRKKLEDEEEASEDEGENQILYLEESMKSIGEQVSDDLAPLLSNISLEDKLNEPKLGKKIDFRKFVLKTEYTNVQYFESTGELGIWLKEQSLAMKTDHSNFVKCSLYNCDDDLHKMRIQYMHCECCKKCDLKFRIKSCMVNDNIEVSRSFAYKCCCRETQEECRGPILPFIKDALIKMLEYDADLTPKRAHTKLTEKRKKYNSFPVNLLPSLKQVS